MKKLLIFVFLLALAGCAGDSDSSDSVATSGDAYSVGGFIQKGPFVAGSSITIQELDAYLEPTGESYQTTTDDDLGTFSLGSTIGSEYVEIIASGYYFNEISGIISTAPLTLRSIAKLTVSESCNVNLLTTLTRLRLKNLVVSGIDFDNALEQAEDELLAVFNAPDISGTFNSLNITELGEQNEVLLAITVMLQNNNSVGDLSELIAKIALDIEDGALDDSTIMDEIVADMYRIDPAAIKANIEDRYGAYGVTVTIGSFDSYLDSDGDGILNKDEDEDIDEVSFTAVVDADLDTEYQSNTVTISGITGTIPIIGTAYHNGTLETDFAAANGDEVKLSLASSANYATPVSASIQIGDTTYTYTVTTKADDRQQIIVFDSGQPAQDGDFGYANAQAWCNAEATNQGLTGTITPWLSNSAFDSGTDFAPFTPDAVNPRQVQSLTGGLIASKWTEFFNAEGTDTLQSLGVVDDGYWTGMVSGPSYDGRTTYNCDQWTRNGNIVNDLDYGNYNRHDIADRTTEGSPQAVNTTTCDQLKKILCIAY